MKNIIFLIPGLLLFALSACSDSNDDIITDNFGLEKTVWKRPLKYESSGELHHYESFEFFPYNKFSLSQFDLNGVRTKYILMGEYTQNVSKDEYEQNRYEIKCTYKHTNNSPTNYPRDRFTLILDPQLRTINLPCWN